MSGPWNQSPEALPEGEMRTPRKPCCGELGEVVGSGGVERIDAGDALEDAGVLFEDAGEVGVVVAVVDDLDDDGAGDSVGLHQREQGFGGGVAFGDVGARGEGEGGVVLPDVDVGVEDAVVGGHKG